jgi:hypothetical protein
VIDAYETAFSHDVYEHANLNGRHSNFGLHNLIEFFSRNILFSRYGFYPGFTDLLWASIFSDPRSQSDVWLISVLVKFASLGVSDPVFAKRIEQLVDSNVDRYANTSIVKLAVLVTALNESSPRHRDLLLKKLKSLNLEQHTQSMSHLLETRMQSTLLLSVAYLDSTSS